MDLKEFVEDVLVDLDQAIDEASEKASREIRFSEKENARTIEFDIAISVGDTTSAAGKAGIKVLKFADAGGDISKEHSNSTVSRVTFGVYVSRDTKDERQRELADFPTSRVW